MNTHTVGRVECVNALSSAKEQWAETREGASVFVNWSRHVAVTSDTACTVRLNAAGHGSFEIAADLEAEVPKAASLRFDALLRTSTLDGVPATVLAGSASMSAADVLHNVGRAVEMELFEASDPGEPRGKLRVTITRAKFPLDTKTPAAHRISDAEGRKLAQESMRPYYNHDPPAWLPAATKIHTPLYAAAHPTVPGGFYTAALPHVASEESVWTNLLRIALDRASVSETDFVRIIDQQRAIAEQGDAHTVDGIHDACVVIGLATSAAPVHAVYMFDHKRATHTHVARSAHPTTERATEQMLSLMRKTGTGDCEDKAHDTYVNWLEIGHGPGRMDAPQREWSTPLVRAASWLAREGYAPALITWAVSAAALDGHAPDSTDVICHIGAAALPRARISATAKDVMPSVKGAAWTSGLPSMPLEGTGLYYPNFTNVPARMRAAESARMALETAHPELENFAPMLCARDGPEASPFYRAAISGYAAWADGVVDVWFESKEGTYGVSTRDFVDGCYKWGACLKMNQRDYDACVDVVKGASVPPCMYTPPAPSERVVSAARDISTRYAPEDTGGTYWDYFIRTEMFMSAMPALHTAASSTRGITCHVEPLANDVTVVRARVYAKA